MFINSASAPPRHTFWLHQELKESQFVIVHPSVHLSGSSLSRALHLHHSGSGLVQVSLKSLPDLCQPKNTSSCLKTSLTHAFSCESSISQERFFNKVDLDQLNCTSRYNYHPGWDLYARLDESSLKTRHESCSTAKSDIFLPPILQNKKTSFSKGLHIIKEIIGYVKFFYFQLRFKDTFKTRFIDHWWWLDDSWLIKSSHFLNKPLVVPDCFLSTEVAESWVTGTGTMLASPLTQALNKATRS